LSAAHPPAPALKPGAALGRVLIVGGDGLIGRALAGDLAARGWRVRATTRRAGPGPALDLATPFDAAAVTEGVDALVLSAAVTGRAVFSVIDHVARATCDGAEGWGLFEHGTIGRHAPSGFEDFGSVAP